MGSQEHSSSALIAEFRPQKSPAKKQGLNRNAIKQQEKDQAVSARISRVAIPATKAPNIHLSNTSSPFTSVKRLEVESRCTLAAVCGAVTWRSISLIIWLICFDF